MKAKTGNAKRNHRSKKTRVNNSKRNSDKTHVNDSSNKTAAEFYDIRYQNNYMESWPVEKCSRVENLLRVLRLPENGCVLDFGCGAGVFTSVLKSALPNWEVAGTDISITALQIAAANNPDCRFYRLDELKKVNGQFDFIFTHHVLEHVPDLTATAEMFSQLLKPSGAMLHILPCADPGSLEHYICILRKDGMIGDSEKRFFFDEEGHLRRLTTKGLSDLWISSNFRIKQAFYANRFYGGLKFITTNGFDFIFDVTDTKSAINRYAAAKLYLLRFMLIAICALRKPIDIVANKRKYGLKSFSDYLKLALGIFVYPISKCIDWALLKLVDLEWKKKHDEAGGSEMYIYFVRSTP